MYFDTGIVGDLALASQTIEAGEDGRIYISGFEHLDRGGFIGNDMIDGSATANKLNGGGGDDKVSGGGGADEVQGGDGDDVLNGGLGDDTLFDYSGRDRLRGDAGADVFKFGRISETPLNGRDTIADFTRGDDKIDLSTFWDYSFDVTSNSLRVCEFRYVGARAFSGNADEVRLESGVLFGDSNQDGFADFAIRLPGIAALSAADFIF